MPIEELLPPLTSRNDVDLQLYALISIILRESVQNWYGKITADETFVAEIVQIIAHVTRALEQRLRKIDLESLLLDELPDLLDAHVRAYRIAKHGSVARPPLESNLREIYHSLWPLPALSPVPHGRDGSNEQAQNKNELAYRQLLTQGMLALLLPTEDLQNECLMAIVGQILSEMIVGNLVIEKPSQPWLLWEILIILARLGQEKETPVAERQHSESQQSDRISVAGTQRQPSILTRLFWSTIQGIFLVFSFGRLLLGIFTLSRSLPPRTSSHAHSPRSIRGPNGKSYAASITSEVDATTPDVPVLTFAILPCIGNLIEIQGRMPWLAGLLSLLQWAGLNGPGRIANVDGILDRLLSHCIQTSMLSPDLLPPLLRSVRGALFPNNAPGTSTLVAPSSEEELAALKRRCARAIWGIIPERVGRLYYGANPWAWLRSPLSTQHVVPQQGQQRATSAAAAGETRSVPLDGCSSGTDRSESNAKRTETYPGLGAARPHSDQQHGMAHKGFAAVGNVVHVTQARSGAADQRQQQTNKITSATASVGYERSTRRTYGSVESAAAHSSEDARGHKTADEAGKDPEIERVLDDIETGFLDIFSDPYCNKHLLYSLLELAIVRLMPELAERGVVDLLEERLL